MNEFFRIIDRKADCLTGRYASSDELDMLSHFFSKLPWINEFRKLVKDYRIIGMDLNLSENEDFSGVGVSMKWTSPKEQVDEAFNFYPGKIVYGEGFLPIGDCLTGSGNPYFLKIEDYQWKIYRALHDLCVGDSYSDEMVEFVAELSYLLDKQVQFQ